MMLVRRFFLMIVAVYLLPTLLRAQEFGQTGPSGKLQNPLNYGSIPDLIRAILDIVVQIGVPIVALFIVYAGFLFVKARGNPEELKVAKTALGWTLVGAAVLLGASVLAEVIGGTITELRG